MEIIRNIVKCTPEQYLELLTNGEVEVNGEIKTYNENTLYDTGNLELIEWYNKIMTAQYQEYEVAHTPIIAKPLEKEIADIIKQYPDYKSSSCIGYRTFLNKGDIVGVASKYNNGETFINGERVTANYSCKTDGELVNVVVFESGYYMSGVANPPVLGATPSYFPHEIYIKNIGQIPEVAETYYLYANKITTYNFTLAEYPRAARVINANGTSYFSQKVATVSQEVYSNCEYFNTKNLLGTLIRKLSLPNCKEFGGTVILINSSTIKEYEFGKLEKISGGTSYGTGATFRGANTVLIPDTVKTITGVICGDNTTIKLECNKAKSIGDTWCYNAPTNFTMAKNWDASVNISKAAKNWTKDRFLELFEDLVPVNINGGTMAARELTIPAAIFDTLTDEEYAIAEDKGWVLGGA